MEIVELDPEVIQELAREWMLDGFELTSEQLDRIPSEVSMSIH